MLEGAQLFAVSSAALLVAAFLVWAKILKGPLLERLDGSRASNARPAELAARILATALAVSAIAAVAAVIDWMIT